MAIQLDLNEHEEQIFNEVLEKYGYESPTDFIRRILKMHNADKRIDRLSSLASRMFPNGIKKREEHG